MIKGFYAAVSAMVANANRQQILAHNAANLDTPGFKQVMSTFDDFLETPVVFPPGNLQNLSAMTYAGMLGLGVENSPEITDFTQGALQLTGNMFDLAIEGDGFYRIETENGERYTRDGRFIRDAEGFLVTVDGNYVLDDAGQRIELPNGEILISLDGEVYSENTVIAQIGMAFFADPAAELTPDEGNLFVSEGDPTGEGNPRIMQGYLEMSNVNETQLMTQMVEVARSYEAAQKMVQNQDELTGKAISSLGRIG